MSPLTPLVEPADYFADRRPSLARSGAAVALSAVLVAAAFLGVGWSLTERMDATVEVDNPARPPEVFCEGPGTPVHPGCDEPATREARLGDLVWERLVGQVPVVLLVVPVVWVLAGVALYVAATVLGGEGRFAPALAVAGWGLVPLALSSVAGAALLVWSLRGVTFGTDPGTVVDQLRALQPRAGGTWVLDVAVAAWQTYVWGHGLASVQSLPLRAAGGGAAVVALGMLLVGAL